LEFGTSANLNQQAPTIMKKNILILTLLAITCSFGQAKKVKSIPKKTSKEIEVKEIPIEERINYIKGDPYGDETLAIESAPIIREEDVNTIYNTAGIEVKPEFPGGYQKLDTYITKYFQYSDEMKEAELKGKIFASFVVERDGSITDIKIIRGMGYGTEKAALEVLKKMPRWNPGEQNGKKVRCSYTVPITIYATKQ
jgi:protein TonB